MRSQEPLFIPSEDGASAIYQALMANWAGVADSRTAPLLTAAWRAAGAPAYCQVSGLLVKASQDDEGVLFLITHQPEVKLSKYVPLDPGPTAVAELRQGLTPNLAAVSSRNDYAFATPLRSDWG